jgi:hypothetical protein
MVFLRNLSVQYHLLKSNHWMLYSASPVSIFMFSFHLRSYMVSFFDVSQPRKYPKIGHDCFYLAIFLSSHNKLKY